MLLVDVGEKPGQPLNQDLVDLYRVKGFGYPALAVLDKQGNLLCAQSTGVLEKGKGHDPAKVLAFLNMQLGGLTPPGDPAAPLHPMFAYQQDGRFFAQAARGLEELARIELEELGASDVETSGGGLHFRSDAAGLYRVNYCSRLVSRVLAPLAAFPCFSEQALYDAARAIDWERILFARADLRRLRQCLGEPHRPFPLRRPAAERRHRRSFPRALRPPPRRGHGASRCLDQPEHPPGPGGDQPGYVRRLAAPPRLPPAVGGGAAAGDAGRGHGALERLAGGAAAGRPHVRLGDHPGRGVHALLPRARGLQKRKIRLRDACPTSIPGPGKTCAGKAMRP